MKRILTTTALATLIAGGAVAEEHAPFFVERGEVGQIRGSTLIGTNVYAADIGAHGADDLVVRGTRLMSGETEIGWDDVGEVDDLILTRDGQVHAVLLGIGGFLGIGEKTVGVSIDRLRFVDLAPRNTGADGDTAATALDAAAVTGQFYLVIDANVDTLRDAPSFDRSSLFPRSPDSGGMQPETSGMQAGDVQPMAEATPSELAAADRAESGFEQVAHDDLTAEELHGRNVYGANGDRVGEISELILSAEGRIEGAIVDVGGFLGLGEKRIRVPFDALTVQHNAETGEVRVQIDATEESLKEQEEYRG